MEVLCFLFIVSFIYQYMNSLALETQKEIEDLLVRLTHLRAEEKEHTRQIDELDARIRNMTAGLAGERDELAREKEAIAKRMEEIDARVVRDSF